MSDTELLLLLFSDTLLDKMLLPIHYAYVFDVIKHFSTLYQDRFWLLMLSANLGAIIGLTINWYIGSLCQLVPIKIENSTNKLLDELKNIIERFIIPVSFIVCWLNIFGALILCLCGYLKTRLRPMLLTIAVSSTINMYYLFYIKEGAM